MRDALSLVPSDRFSAWIDTSRDDEEEDSETSYCTEYVLLASLALHHIASPLFFSVSARQETTHSLVQYRYLPPSLAFSLLLLLVL